MSKLFEDDLYGREGQKGSLKRVAGMYRTAKGVPEAFVKVSSYSKTMAKALANLEYISREGTLPLELNDGTVLRDIEDIKHTVEDYGINHKEGHRLTCNMVLSSKSGTDPHKVTKAVREFAKTAFHNREWMFTLHHDTNNLHAHLTVKMRDFEGEQLRLGRKELKSLRDLYAEKLSEQGIESNASYRTERGKFTHRRDRRSGYRKPANQARMQKFYEKHTAEFKGTAKFLREKFGDKFSKQADAIESHAKSLESPELER